MQMITLPNLYSLNHLIDDAGTSLTGFGLHTSVDVSFQVSPDASPCAVTLFQSGRLTLAHGLQHDDKILPAGLMATVSAVWWTTEGFSGSLLTIGETYGLATDEPLVAGHHYTFSHQVFGRSKVPHDGLMAGTMIRCGDGMREVSKLRQGDLVWTEHRGLRALRGVYKISCPAWGHSAPIVIQKNTLGATHDLVLAPTQNVVLDGAAVRLYKNGDGATAKIGKLSNGDTIRPADLGFVTYIVLDFASPVCLEANGVLVRLDCAPHFVSDPNLPNNIKARTVLTPQDSQVVGAML